MHRRDQRAAGDKSSGLVPRLLECHVRIREMLAMGAAVSCRDLVDAPTHWQELRAAVARAARALSPMMATHLLEEERDLFPAIERLGDDVQARILEEMDERRPAGR